MQCLAASCESKGVPNRLIHKIVDDMKRTLDEETALGCKILPQLWPLIFSFLDSYQKICLCSTVSRDWNALAKFTVNAPYLPSFPNLTDLHIHDSPDPSRLACLLQLRKITLTNYYNYGTDPFAFTLFTNLTYLDIPSASNVMKDGELATLTNLTHLNIFCTDGSGAGISALTNLTWLKFGYDTITDAIISPPDALANSHDRTQ
jgi:hypothetical protein